MDKKAYNPIKSKGFDSKAQARFLLHLMEQYPEKYSWVKSVLKEFGMPSEEGPLHTYWKGPYNVSPETPSYTYTSRTKANTTTGLTKFSEAAIKHHSPKKVVDIFLAPYIEQIAFDFSTDPQETLNKWSTKFNSFLTEYGHLDSFETMLAREYFQFRVKTLLQQKTASLLKSAAIKDESNPKTLANIFWALWKNDIMLDRRNPESLSEWFNKFRQFLDDHMLTALQKEEAQHHLGDKILGREVE